MQYSVLVVAAATPHVAFAQIKIPFYLYDPNAFKMHTACDQRKTFAAKHSVDALFLHDLLARRNESVDVDAAAIFVVPVLCS